MTPRWYSGQYIVSNWKIEESELFDMLNAGVQACTKNTGLKVVDRDSLPKVREYPLAYFEKLEELREGLVDAGKVIGKGGRVGIPPPKREANVRKQDAIREWVKQKENFFIDPKGCESISFTLPDDNIGRRSAFNKAVSFRYLAADTDKYFDNEDNQNHPLPVEESESVVAAPPVPVKTNAGNFFTRGEDKHWRVGFNGKEGIIDLLDGVHYISILLKRPGTSISCKDLYQTALGETSDNIMSEGAAIGEGLNIGSSKQGISDRKARKICSRKYQELQEMLPEVGIEEQEEIEAQMKKLMPYLTRRNIPGPNEKKAQVNIGKRLDTAYEAIRKADMEELAKHLQDHIKTDGAFGLSYSGSITWEITL